MIAEIGAITLILAFAFAVYATIASAYGGWRGQWAWVESARNAVLLVFGLLTVAVVLVVYSLYTYNFSLAYVADVSSRAMSAFLRITALWGGQSGSLLFWSWLMAGFIAAVALRKWDSDRELMPYVLATAMFTATFFISLVLFLSNPFARLWHVPGEENLVKSIFAPPGGMPFIPADGQGLNPLLRHFGMIGHPPTTYVGFTGFVIPYAFAVAALITGRSRDDAWIRTTRRWTLIAWLFLSIGLLLGGRWAYDVLGWGGFWGWDPVENAMLMPWLTGTAFLHSVMITEKRGMLKVWSVVLIILTYILSIFGTFITRTGLISSVHAFAKSGLGVPFFVFLGISILGSLTLLFKRLDTLKTEHELESFLSREAVFLLQNMLFVAITVAVFWGTVFPMISELVTGERITVGPPYFEKVTGPMFAALVLLMGVAPFFAWRKQTAKRLGQAMWFPFATSVALALGLALWMRMHPAAAFGIWLVAFVTLATLLEFWKGIQARRRVRGENVFTAMARLIARNRRRYGGYIVHLGVFMMALGVIGDAYFQKETQAPLTVGQTLSIDEYTIRFEGLRAYNGSDGREIVEATVSLFRDGEFVRTLKPRRDFFVVQQQPVTIPAVYSTPVADVYVLLVGWEEISFSSSTFKMYLNPLIVWLWTGGIVLIIGTMIAMWPAAAAERETSYVLRPGVLQPQASAGG